MEASIALLLGLLAFCILSMDLPLGIVYRKLAGRKGATALIVFVATSLALVFFMVLDSWSALSFTGAVYRILEYVWAALLLMDICFLLSYVPYFTTWIIGHRWRNPYKVLFYTVSAAYGVLSIVDMILPSALTEVLCFILCFFTVFFCEIVMIKNRRGIDDADTRALLLTTFIIGLCMLPFIVASIFIPFIRRISTQCFFLAYSIEILVFLFLAVSRLAKDRRKQSAGVDLSVYHISERESQVIGLVGQGLTNKEIAARLGLSVNTVNNHMANIFSKTGVRSRIDLLNLIHKGIWQ